MNVTNQTPVTAIGMVWYRLEDYDAIRRIMADREKLPDTFSEWRMKAETGEKTLRRAGHIVVRAFIDPETFPDWCRARGLDIDTQARNRFAAEIAEETVERSHGEAGGRH
jgi:hypothetical protein